MRVLHYVDESDLSWGRPWVSLLCKLSDLGIDNIVVCRGGGTLSGQLKEKGFASITYKPLVPALPVCAKGFSDILDEIKPDIIHTRLSSAALIAGSWGRKKHIPVVSTIDKHAKLKYYAKSSLLLPCSKSVENFMVKQGWVQDKSHIVYNPIDLAIYKKNTDIRDRIRAKYHVADSVKIIVSAGRFDDGKGFETLLKAYAIVRSKINLQTQLWLLGDGKLKQSFVKLASELGIEKDIILPGFVSNIQKYFWACDIFVLPSEMPEAFGIVLLEAMASGLPCVVSKIGGALEVARANIDCLTFEPKNALDMSDKILNLLKDTDKMILLAQQAEKRAENFGLDKIALQTIEIYKNLLKEKKDE